MKKKLMLALIVLSTQNSLAELSVDYHSGQSCQPEAHYCYYGELRLPCDPTEKTGTMRILCENGDQYTLVEKIRIEKNNSASATVKILGEEYSFDISGCQIVR